MATKLQMINRAFRKATSHWFVSSKKGATSFYAPAGFKSKREHRHWCRRQALSFLRSLEYEEEIMMPEEFNQDWADDAVATEMSYWDA